MTKRQTAAILRAALDYAEQGFDVFPCGLDKTPRVRNGFKAATHDVEKVREMFAADDLCIGMAVPDGFVIIDSDPRNGSDDDMKALRREHGRGAFPRTLTARTGGGGEHRWYRCEDGAQLKSKLTHGIDVKRPGKGYLIAPPSKSEQGAYEWTDERDAVELPDWMHEALLKPEPVAREASDRDPVIPPFSDGTRYGEAAMSKELEELRDAREGGRNDALNKAAFSLGQLVGGGELLEAAVRDELWKAATDDLGLPPSEAAVTLDSGLLAGLQEPRNAPERDDAPKPTQGTSARLSEAYSPPEDDEGFWLDLNEDAPEAQYILWPMLPREAYVLVYGATEASKSMVLNLLGAEASHHGFSVSVYSLENPPNVDRSRLKRMQPSVSFRLTNQLVNLADPAQAEALALREHGRDLVIIDTYSHAYAQRYDSGDGNAKAIEFARVIRWLIRETGATFVVVDHTGFERPDEPRDASAKRQQVDVAIGMQRTERWERGKPARFSMTNYKSARYANPFSYRGKIVGNDEEPLKLVWEGVAQQELEWQEP